MVVRAMLEDGFSGERICVCVCFSSAERFRGLNGREGECEPSLEEGGLYASRALRWHATFSVHCACGSCVWRKRVSGAWDNKST